METTNRNCSLDVEGNYNYTAAHKLQQTWRVENAEGQLTITTDLDCHRLLYRLSFIVKNLLIRIFFYHRHNKFQLMMLKKKQN